MTERDNSTPYWGHSTSTLDWCEENYVDHKYIAEFVNTTTNLIFIGLASFGIYITAKYGFETRFTIAYAAIALIGIGSWMFHMTLLYEFQLLDELPMIYGTCVLVHNIFETGHKRKYGIYLPLGLFVYASSITIAYLYILNPVFHQVSYAILVTVLNIRSYYLLSLIPKGNLHSTLKKLLFGAWAMFGMGFFLWNVDNIACDNLKLARARVGRPLGYLLELHGWWHIGTAFGTYYWIVFNQYLRVALLGKENEWKLNWTGFGAIPYMSINDNAKKDYVKVH
ncbi:8304_t:CDS:2 [Acaulospora morrowiae]|uniref:8304_t:CDS:1 n=1 Tax=Acaulospora morrowiae TaxID=94023 RepID=A0A9N8ZBR3_9GLOM|nr:8304_t:CDS:2 [Acaulospora morrowiae]